MFTVELIVTPRPGVRDPQAEALGEALPDLQVLGVGRYLALRLKAQDAAAAQARAETLCRELLVNPNLETFQLRIEAVDA